MPRRNSTVEIKNGKVVFSEEVLSYFENIRTEENSEWIDKYFEYLSDESNLIATKYSGHHIIPCFTFKDETHKNRKETESLADKIEGNIIKLSVYNHLLAHHCLWKIFKNIDSRTSFQRMCKEDIDDLSENEIKEIAKIQEECAKENVTKEKRAKQKKDYYENNKEKILKRNKERYENNKESISKQRKEFRKNNKEKISKRNKEYRENNKEHIREHGKEYRENNKEKLSKQSKEHYEKNKEKILKRHKKYREENKEKINEWQANYRKNNKEKISEKQKRWREKNKDKVSEKSKEYYKSNKEEISEKHRKYSNRLCLDPTNGTKCTLGALRGRKSRNKEKYENVIPQNCIIKDDEIIS